MARDLQSLAREMAGRPREVPQVRRAVWMLVAATFAWGASFPLAKAAMLAEAAAAPGFSTWVYSAFSLVVRFGASALILALWRPRMLRGISRLEWKESIGLGVFLAGGNLLQADGLGYTSAGTSAFLTQFYCVLIPLALAWRRRTWPSFVVTLSCGMVFAGAGLVSHFDWHSFRLGRGELETLASSFFYAAGILWLARGEFRDNDRTRVSMLMFAIVAAALFPMVAGPARALSDLALSLKSPLILATLGALTLLCTLFAFATMNKWQPRIEATHAGLIYCLEPVFAALFALFLPGWLSAWGGLGYLDEEVTFDMLLGGALITAANALIAWKPATLARSQRHAPPQPRSGG